MGGFGYEPGEPQGGRRLGREAPVPGANQGIRLFKSTLENPAPDTEVSHLDFVLGKVSVRPFVVAITAE